jgi:hypothetical protein
VAYNYPSIASARWCLLEVDSLLSAEWRQLHRFICEPGLGLGSGGAPNRKCSQPTLIDIFVQTRFLGTLELALL